jgi:hypothetical protein
MERAKKLAETTYKDVQEHDDIPLADRPCYNHCTVVGRVRRGIRMSPSDFDVVSYGFYEKWWVFGRNLSIDPWGQGDVEMVLDNLATGISR